MLQIQIKPGEEVVGKLTKELAERGVQNAVIVSVIGAVDECRISTMSPDDASKDIMHEYKQPLELLGTGEVKDGAPHIHCTLGTESGGAAAGHLHHGSVESWFVNVYWSHFRILDNIFGLDYQKRF